MPNDGRKGLRMSNNNFRTVTANISFVAHHNLIRIATGRGVALSKLVVEILENHREIQLDVEGNSFAINDLRERNDVANAIMEMRQDLNNKKMYDMEAKNKLIAWAKQIGFEGGNEFVESLDSSNDVSISAGENNGLSTKIIQWRQAELKPFTIRDICRKYNIKTDRAISITKFLVMAGFLFANVEEIDSGKSKVTIYSYDILSESERQKQDFSWVKFPFDFIRKDFKNSHIVMNDQKSPI